MPEGRLYIGNRRYSSWSMRGWLAVKLAGLDVEYRPRMGHSALLLVGLGEDLPHRVEVLVLAGPAAQAHDRSAIP